MPTWLRLQVGDDGTPRVVTLRLNVLPSNTIGTKKRNGGGKGSDKRRTPTTKRNSGRGGMELPEKKKEMNLFSERRGESTSQSSGAKA